MKNIVLLVSLLLSSFPCFALYECPEHGRVILSSAPCDTVFHTGASARARMASMAVPLNRDGAYMVQGDIQGAAVNFQVDTGANVTTVSSRVAALVGLSCGSFGTTETANGATASCNAVARSLRFGDFELRDVTVAIVPNMKMDALLGMNVLSRFSVDQRSSVLYISR